MINRLLTEKRGVTSDWHFDQAEALLEFALQHDSATALVYAALEARNALERFVLEMSPLATGGHLSDEQIHTAQHRDGAFQLLDKAMSNYRRHLQFTNLTLEEGDDPFRVAIPNVGQFRRLRTNSATTVIFSLIRLRPSIIRSGLGLLREPPACKTPSARFGVSDPKLTESFRRTLCRPRYARCSRLSCQARSIPRQPASGCN